MTALARAICFALVVTCMCGGASATDYYFNVVASGDWNDDYNWWPSGGPPGCGDTATIPNGHTCIVAAADQCAECVTVAFGATLRIDNRRLSIDAGGGTGLTANGTVEFKNTATLTTLSSLTVAGSGSLITLSSSEAWVGTVLEDSSIWITIQSGVTFKGSFKFRANIHNDGILAVDSSSHDMEIGEADGTRAPSGPIRHAGRRPAPRATIFPNENALEFTCGGEPLPGNQERPV